MLSKSENSGLGGAKVYPSYDREAIRRGPRPIPIAILSKYIVFCKIAIGKGIQGARAPLGPFLPSFLPFLPLLNSYLFLSFQLG